MRVPATLPFAAFLGLPPRKKVKGAARRKQFKAATRPKTRRRESRSTSAPVKKMFHVARAETRRSDRKSRPATFAELLDVDLPPSGRAHHQPDPAVAGVPVPQPEPPPRHDGLSPAARRIIALGAEARGENIEPDGIEAKLKRERDEACGITEVARAIIDRKGAKVAAGGVRSGREAA